MKIVVTLLVIQMVILIVTYILALNSKYNYMIALQEKGYRKYTFYGMKYLALFIWLTDFKHIFLNKEHPDPQVEPLRKTMRRYHFVNLFATLILFAILVAVMETSP